MARENKTRYAVLGMLAIGPMSGYEIKKLYERGPIHFWKESYGQIYPILKRLVAEGLAEVRTEQQEGRPDRKVYSLTKEGRRALHGWLAEPPETPTVRIELLLKLFFGQFGEPAALADHVRRCREEARGQAATYRKIEEGFNANPEWRQKPGPSLQLLTLRYGQHITRAVLDWCEEALAELERLERKPTAKPHQTRRR